MSSKRNKEQLIKVGEEFDIERHASICTDCRYVDIWDNASLVYKGKLALKMYNEEKVIQATDYRERRRYDDYERLAVEDQLFIDIQKKRKHLESLGKKYGSEQATVRLEEEQIRKAEKGLIESLKELHPEPEAIRLWEVQRIDIRTAIEDHKQAMLDAIQAHKNLRKEEKEAAKVEKKAIKDAGKNK